MTSPLTAALAAPLVHTPVGQREVGFYLRWVGHKEGAPVGPFESMDEVTSYMTRCGLPAPNEVVWPHERKGHGDG